jgi:hypothetical protein
MGNGLQWGPAYTQGELDDAQARWSIRFPPDLVGLYREHRPLFPEPGAIDWVGTAPEVIRERLDWPLEGFWFDVQHGNLWWPEWGEKPQRAEEQLELLRAAFRKAPVLIPLYAHRYIPETPSEAGNPVFSVYQSDIIHYGSDLMDYLEREADSRSTKRWPGSIKYIEFWTMAVERNGVR